MYLLANTRTSKLFFFSCLLVVVLLLLCLVCYPFGADQAVYSIGGDLILKRGAFPYRDFIEAKPPLIFYLYSASLWLFGHHEWSPRLLDVIVQTGAVWLLYNIIFDVFKEEKIALLSITFYVILYVSGGYWETTDTESFSILPNLILLKLILDFEKGRFSKATSKILIGFILGICTAVLFTLKFTLVASYGAAAVYILFFSKSNLRSRISLFTQSALWLMGFIGLFMIWLAINDGWNNFVLMVDYLRGYSNIQPLFNIDTIRLTLYQNFPSATIINLTPTVIALTVIGIFYLKEITSKPSAESSSKPANSFFVLITLQLVIGLGSILFERKFFIYHYQRIFWCIAPLMALGLHRLSIIEWLKKNSRNIKKMLPAILLFLIAIFYSPISRIAYHPLRWAWLTIRGDEVRKRNILIHDNQSIADRIQIDSFLMGRQHSNDGLFVWGASADLYFRYNKLPPTLSIINFQLMAPWAPNSWLDTMIHQLSVSLPKHILIEQLDATPTITGRTIDSYQYTQEYKPFKDLLNGYYTEIKTTTHFHIFERKNLN